VGVNSNQRPSGYKIGALIIKQPHLYADKGNFDGEYIFMVFFRGRYAGKKAIAVRNFDDDTSEKQFGHVLVAGIDRYPRRVHIKMGKAKIHKR
jgi:hypothetical protein